MRKSLLAKILETDDLDFELKDILPDPPDYSTYIVNFNPYYYGINLTKEQADLIFNTISNRVREQFRGIKFRRFDTERELLGLLPFDGGPDQKVVKEIHQFISEYWKDWLDGLVG
jgi:hypothetical protein